MRYQQVAHLVAMTHLLRHDPGQATQVILAGSGVVQMALLLHRGKLRIALVDNVVEESITDTLIGDVAHGLPAACPSIIPKGNLLACQVAVFGVKGKASHMLVVQTNVILPGAKCCDPVIKGVNSYSHDLLSPAGRLILHTTKAWHPFLHVGPQP